MKTIICIVCLFFTFTQITAQDKYFEQKTSPAIVNQGLHIWQHDSEHFMISGGALNNDFDGLWHTFIGRTDLHNNLLYYNEYYDVDNTTLVEEWRLTAACKKASGNSYAVSGIIETLVGQSEYYFYTGLEFAVC